MAREWAELKKASKEELKAEYGQRPEDPYLYGDFQMRRTEIRDELHHREIRGYTRAMLAMTVVITFATIANVILWTLK